MRQDFEFFDLGRFGEKVVGVGEEGLGDFAGEVGVAAGFIFKGVEDAEAAGAEFDGIPRGSAGFGDGEGLGGLEELFEFLFLAFFGG